MDIIHLQTGPLGVNTYIVPCCDVPLHEDKANGELVGECGFASEAYTGPTVFFFVVDPGGDADVIVNAIETHSAFSPNNGEKVTQCPLKGIVLTHGHFDHVGAVAALKERYPSAMLCIHGEDAPYIGANAYNLHREDFGTFGADYLVEQATAMYPELPPHDILLAENVRLPFALDWITLHTPGHSRGSVCLYNEREKLLFSGDTLFASAYGRTDLRGGSFKELKTSLMRLFQLPSDVRVYPGHEGLTSIGREKSIQAF